MSKIGHNGGPPTADDVPDMHYVKFFPGDFLNGTAHMSLEQVGAYIRLLCVMYDRMGGFPYDDHKGSILLRVDRRVYRRVRDMLIADGKVFLDGDTLRNTRVENEITSYITEYKRRSEAAKKREADRRSAQTSAELSPDLSGTSAELPAQVREKSGELEAKKVTKSTKQEARDGDILEARSQKLESRKEEEKKETPTHDARAGEVHVSNGVFVNCETVRHKDFTVNLLGIEMQLLGAVPLEEIKSVAVGHALQWATDIADGRSPRDVLPRNGVTNWIAKSFHYKKLDSDVNDVRKAKVSSRQVPREKGQSFSEMTAELLEQIDREQRR